MHGVFLYYHRWCNFNTTVFAVQDFQIEGAQKAKDYMYMCMHAAHPEREITTESSRVLDGLSSWYLRLILKHSDIKLG